MEIFSLWNRVRDFSLTEVAAGLLSSPLVSVALALALAVAVVPLARRRVSDGGVLPGERVALASIAGAVGAGWIIDVVLRGYVFDMSATVSWWRFAIPPAIAAAGLSFFALTRGTAHPRRPTAAATVLRRTWTTFGPRRGIAFGSILAVSIIVIAAVFGGMSFSFDSGPSAHVALPVPNTDEPPVVTAFPGWAYGIPLIVSVLLLAAATALVLHRGARRPFSAQIAPDLERRHRSIVAREAMAIAIGAGLIALAGLLRMARGGAVTSTTTMTDSGVGPAMSVNLPHADLIIGGGFVAPLLEIGGCVLLLLLVIRAVGVDRVARRRSTMRVEAGA